MKITIIGPAHPLRGGGMTTFNERLTRALLDDGQEADICSFSLQYPSFLFPGTTQYTDEPAPEGIRIRSLINSVNPANWLKVGDLLRREKPDLVIVRYWLPFMGPALGTILRRVRKNRHTKIIGIIDNAIPHEKRAGDRAFTKYFLKPVDAFLSMSQEVLRDLREFDTRKPAMYSPHPVYDNYGDILSKKEARRKLNLPEEGRYILFFGLIRKYKGLDLLLEALADERIKQGGIKLIVAGEYYGDKEYYEEIMNRLALQDRLCLFTRFIPNEEVRDYFCASDCVVQPYRTATQSGISQIAYHFEKPMIVTHVGGLPEIVPDNKVGFVTEVTPGAIADAIVRFYDENKEAGFIANLKEEKKRYSWDYFLSALSKLYQQV